MMRHDEDGKIKGLVEIQEDETLAIRNQELLADEERESSHFKENPISIISNEATAFN